MRDNREKRIGHIGSGRLYQAVQQHLEYDYQLLSLRKEDIEQQAKTCSLILYCDDYWHFQTQREINRQLRAIGIPWLPTYTEFGVGIVGPCVLPTRAGCVVCVETRRLAATKEAEDHTLMRDTLSEGKHMPDQPWLTSHSLEILSRLIVQEVTACLQRPEELQTHNAMLHLKLDTLHCQKHHFLPDPECTVCGYLPADTAQAAMIALQSRPKLAPFTYRTRSLTANAQQLFEEYVDAQTGLIHSLVKYTDASIATVVAQAGISNGKQRSQVSGIGRTLSYKQSQCAAIAEALERYGGQRPKGKRTQIVASYRQLGDNALDPTTLGLHTAEQYALPGYTYVPYHHDLMCRWVWGYSFQRQRSILVPEQYAYYGLHHSAQKSTFPAFVYEISNGCALGNCLEEAIFHGILEVVERDAFLTVWYAQLSVPRLDPLSATDPTVGLLIENLEHATEYSIHVFNSTLDHKVPCCWVMAVNERDNDRPKALCAAGSHPHPEHAVINALQELDVMLKRPYTWSEKERTRALEMLAHPMEVKEMEDHSFLYFLPETFERLSFLYHTPQQHTFHEAFADAYDQPSSLDLRDDLSGLINYYLKLGIDIIVVNQTSPEHTAQQFHCVKVIMPGLLPMTFGHQHRRIAGFKRLSQLPYQLGYRTGLLTDAEINPHPHPFP